MNTAKAELSSLFPPSEDGAIGRALAEFEAKLSAWSEAVSSTHTRLADEYRRAAPTLPARESDVDSAPGAVGTRPLETEIPPLESDLSPDPIVSQSTAVPETTQDSANEVLMDRLTDAMRHGEHLADPGPRPAVAVAVATENPLAPEPTPAAASPDEDTDEILAAVDTDVAEQLRKRHAAAGGKETMREVCDAYFAEASETEALLSTLDPEIAKAVRVQYRLFDGRKSLRQLVDEYEPPKQQKKRSWWKG